MKENIKAPRHWPLCGEFTDDRWIPRIMASNAENVSIWWRHHIVFNWIAVASQLWESTRMVMQMMAARRHASRHDEIKGDNAAQKMLKHYPYIWNITCTQLVLRWQKYRKPVIDNSFSLVLWPICNITFEECSSWSNVNLYLGDLLTHLRWHKMADISKTNF